MASSNTGLKPKHYKALELWEEGILSLKEIAHACKIPEDTMYDLFEGNSQKAGETAHLFRAELEKITKRTAAKVRHLVKDNKKIALYMMNNRLKELKAKVVTKEVSYEIARILSVLGKVTPSVAVENNFHSLSITRGMTAEELAYEFRRLNAIARLASNGGTIQGPDKGAEGRIS